MISAGEDHVSGLQSPGRTCPLHWRYRPEDFAVPAPAQQQAPEVLHVVGGLYGNELVGRLRLATTASQRAELSALPIWQRADVGSLRLGLVHGEATSLAGWGFAQEHLRDAAHRAEVARWLDRAKVDAFACTHTCLPVFQAVPAPSGQHARWILDNGAASTATTSTTSTKVSAS